MTIDSDPRPTTISDETTQTDPRRPIRLRAVGVIAVAALLAAVPFLGSDATQDGSRQFVETERMLALAPVMDTSHEVAELQRFESLAPKIEQSHEFAEKLRMQRLAPDVDRSHETAERRRMLTLQP